MANFDEWNKQSNEIQCMDCGSNAELYELNGVYKCGECIGAMEDYEMSQQEKRDLAIDNARE
jgi:hypothetical protein